MDEEVGVPSPVGGANVTGDLVIPFLDVSTIILCILCKLPQLRTILRSKSVRGVSLNSVLVELLAYSIVLGYNIVKEYPPSSYLEYVFLAFEDVLLLFVIFYYMGILDIVKVGGVGIFITFFYGFTQGIPHPDVLPTLMKFATPCSASSKLLQLREIWKLQNSDSVSVLTWLIAAYTCVTRIATNLMLTGDVPLLVNYCVALALNSAIIFSALYFRRKPNRATAETDNKTEKERLILPQTNQAEQDDKQN